MRSRHVDEFDHTGLEDVYDAEVLDATDPIRAGYAGTLAWVVERAEIAPASRVVDLGAGTGNTSALIPAARHLTCVDISAAMMARARPKLSHLASVQYVVSDLLEFFDAPRRFERLVSTYAVHHLTEDEKALLLRSIASSLTGGGIAVFGDLVFESRDAERALRDRYAARPDVVRSFDEEHYWYLDRVPAMAGAAGLTIGETRRFSDLSWGIRLELTG
jgi:putative AdoMet-dependent methyltransferase